MAITHQSSTKITGSGSSTSGSVDVGTGSNRLLVVSVHRKDSDTLNSITYGGVSMTEADTASNGSIRASIYYMINPSSGSNTLQVDWASSVTTSLYAAAFNGANQYAAFEKAETGTGASNSPSLSITPVSDNTVIVGGLTHDYTGQPTVGSGETEIGKHDHGGWVSGGSYVIQTTATAQSVDWSLGGSDDYAIATAAFREDTEPSDPTTSGLVAWWSLDETSGTRTDSHGSNDLTDYNTVGNGTGKQSNAADFENSNSEALYIADNADVSFGDEDFTLCCWVNLESKVDLFGLMTKYYTTGDQRDYILRYWDGSDVFDITVSPDGTSTGTGTVTASTFGAPSLSTWYFVVAYHDSVNNELGISVNAGAIDTASYSGGVNDGTGEFNIGAFNNHADWFMDGLIDEACIFGKILSQAEINWLYNAGSGRAYSELATSLTTNNLDRIPLGVARGVMRGT